MDYCRGFDSHFKSFLQIEPKEMDEFLQEIFADNESAKTKIKRLRFYLAYKKINNPDQYKYHNKHISTDKYVTIIEKQQQQEKLLKQQQQQYLSHKSTAIVNT